MRKPAAVGVATPAHVMASTEEDVEVAARTSASRSSSSITAATRASTSAIRSDGRGPHPGEEDHLTPRDGPDRGVHRRDRVHGADRREPRGSDPADAYTPVSTDSPRASVQAQVKGSSTRGCTRSRIPSSPPDSRTSVAVFLQLEATSFAVRRPGLADGVPYVLEINANCGIYYPPPTTAAADPRLTHDPAGHRASPGTWSRRHSPGTPRTTGTRIDP